jgi:hypothetical protein
MNNQSHPPPKKKKRLDYEKADLSKLGREAREAVDTVLSIKWTACANCSHAIWWHTSPLFPNGRPCSAHTMNRVSREVIHCPCEDYIVK